MSEEKYYYKVVRRVVESDVFPELHHNQILKSDRIVYKSCIKREKSVYTNNIDLNLTYELNKKTVPPIGKIFVFDSLETALDFKYTLIVNGWMTILKVLAENPRIMNKRSSSIYQDSIVTWWKMMDRELPLLSSCSTPIGTHGADSITPISVVEE